MLVQDAKTLLPYGDYPQNVGCQHSIFTNIGDQLVAILDLVEHLLKGLHNHN